MNNAFNWFVSPATGKQIALNADESKWRWLQRPTIEQLEALLREHEAHRVANYWDWFNSTHSENGDCVVGLVRASQASSTSRYLIMQAILNDTSASNRTLSEFWRRKTIIEQRAMLESVRPSTRSEYVRLVIPSWLKISFPHDFIAILHEENDVDRFMERVWTYACGTDERGPARGTVQQYVEVIAMLRAKSYLLYSLSFWKVVNRNKWEPLKDPKFGASVADLFASMTKWTGARSENVVTYQNLVLSFIAASSASSVSDLSPEFIDAIEAFGLESFLCKDYRTINGRDIRWVASVFRHAYNTENPDKPITRLISEAPPRIDDNMRRSDGRFRWLATACPAMVAWAEPAAAWIKSKGANHATAQITDLNVILDYFRSLEQPPAAPTDLVRSVHIHDVTFKNKQTVMQFLSKSEYVPKRRSRIMSSLRTYLSFYIDWLHQQGQHDLANSFMNPVTDQDKFEHGGSTAGGTHRAAIPGWVLREMETVLTDNNFEFPRSREQSYQLLFDYSCGAMTRVFNPHAAVVILTLLTTPIRSHQARWLDSGEFDEYITDAATGQEVKNPNPLAIPGRRQGCVRTLYDSLRMQSWTGLFVNTNKTAVYGAMTPGYEVPYIKPSMVEHLLMIREWNRRYLPPMAELAVVRRADFDTRHIQDEDIPAGAVPTVATLFRDPSSLAQARAISYNRIARLYTAVLAETEKRIKIKHDLDVSLTQSDAKGKVTWRFDLHTLRVSGISAMIDNGVPLEVVSQFVAGHQTLIMTLWYYRHSPGKLRDAIAKHYAQAEQEGDFVGGEEFERSIEQLAPYLLSKGQADRASGSDPAFAALKEHTGLWAINTDGICPGTSCITGGELLEDAKTYGAVPGGRRCGLCRYWITGPAFIVGQMAEANNLIYQIRKKGQELTDARDQLIEFEDTGMKAEARRVRDRIEYLERELQLDLTEWTNRYSYAMASSELLDKYWAKRSDIAESNNLPAPLLTASSAEELKLTLQHSHEFVLIDHVTQLCDFMPGFQNREARAEKTAMLSKVLAENGMRAFLMMMDREKAAVASDLMSTLLLQYVNAQDIDQVLSGEMKLSQIPELEDKINRIESTVAMQVVPRKAIYLKQET